MPLTDTVETLRVELQLEAGATLIDTIDQACEQLGLTSELQGQGLLAKADACLQRLGKSAVTTEEVIVGAPVGASPPGCGITPMGGAAVTAAAAAVRPPTYISNDAQGKTVSIPGSEPGQGSHTLAMLVSFPVNYEAKKGRQWLANYGPAREPGHGQHWLFGEGRLHFGAWNDRSKQLNLKITWAMEGEPVVICTTVVPGHGGYKLYVNGDIIGTCEGGCDVSVNKLTIGLPELSEHTSSGLSARPVHTATASTSPAKRFSPPSSGPEYFGRVAQASHPSPGGGGGKRGGGGGCCVIS